MKQSYAFFTTFSKSGYDYYGSRNIDTFQLNSPNDLKYYVYIEDDYVKPTSKIKPINITKEIPELFEFQNKYKNNSIIRSKLTKNNKYDPSANFVFDVIRFSFKSYVMFHAIENIPTDWVIWLDGDTFTHNQIDHSLLTEICKPGTMGSYLGRPHLYSETGFLSFNKRHPRILEYVNLARKIYDEGLFLTLKHFEDGFTDCHVFDYTRLELERSGITFHNIASNERMGHPFVNSVLGKYFDHLKGVERKKKGSSNKNDIKNQDMNNVPYWNAINN